MEQVIQALSKLRIGVAIEEYDIHLAISEQLDRSNIPYHREYRLGPRNRIDFLIQGGIGIEVKKGKPNKTQAINQLERYTSFPEISTLILVVERNLDIPGEINGKTCISFGLHKRWGIAL